jgi:hypothetical protein
MTRLTTTLTAEFAAMACWPQPMRGPGGERAMSVAERSAAYRARQKAELEAADSVAGWSLDGSSEWG